MTETIEYKGCSIKIEQDEHAESPREWGNLGTMLCRHPNYILGDRKRGDTQPEVEEILAIRDRKDVVALPLYLLDHSGLWMKTGRFHEDPQGWDTSYVGIIYVEHAKLRKEYSKKRITKATIQKAIEVLEGEVKTYSDYLEGNVVGYIAEGPDGEHIGSCWGFFPEHDVQRGKHTYQYMIDEAKGEIDDFLKTREEQAEQVNSLL